MIIYCKISLPWQKHSESNSRESRNPRSSQLTSSLYLYHYLLNKKKRAWHPLLFHFIWEIVISSSIQTLGKIFKAYFLKLCHSKMYVGETLKGVVSIVNITNYVMEAANIQVYLKKSTEFITLGPNDYWKKRFNRSKCQYQKYRRCCPFDKFIPTKH